MSGYWLSAALILVFTPGAIALADNPPELAGHWQLDAAHSNPGDADTRALDVTQNGKDVSVTRTYMGERGKQMTETFKCTVGGGECHLIDGDTRNAQVSFWYDGSSLVMLKTEGDRRDSTVEWHFQLKDDNTLQVSREVIEPTDKKETLVFSRIEAVAKR